MRPLADAERAAQAKRYLKSDLDFLGVSVPDIRSAVTGTARSRPDPGRDGALAWARALWREPVHERRTAAIEVLRRYTPSLDSADLAQVEAWIRAGARLGLRRPAGGGHRGPGRAAPPGGLAADRRLGHR